MVVVSNPILQQSQIQTFWEIFFWNHSFWTFQVSSFKTNLCNRLNGNLSPMFHLSMALRPSLRCVIDKEGSMENPGNLTSSKSACYKQGGLCFLFFFICFPYFLFWISSNRQKSCRKSMMNSCKSGLSKLQPAACFGTTRELRRDFIFLSGWKKIKRSCHNTWKWQDSQTRVPQWRLPSACALSMPCSLNNGWVE